jgi:hypothetical protein
MVGMGKEDLLRGVRDWSGMETFHFLVETWLCSAVTKLIRLHP